MLLSSAEMNIDKSAFLAVVTKGNKHFFHGICINTQGVKTVKINSSTSVFKHT